MTIGDRQARVAKGAQYLSATYPGWFNRVDRTAMDLANPFLHVLAYATGRPSYHVTEESTWPLAKRVEYGFDDDMDLRSYVLLTAEWSFILRTEYTGRQ